MSNYIRKVQFFLMTALLDDENINEFRKDVYFSLYDIDNDGKRELITQHSCTPTSTLRTNLYDHTGKFFKVKEYDEKGKLVKRDSRFRGLTLFNNGILGTIGVGPNGMYICNYKLTSNGTYTEFLSYYPGGIDQKDHILYYGKKISYKTFEEYDMSIRNSGEKKFKFHKCTKENLNKYLNP